MPTVRVYTTFIRKIYKYLVFIHRPNIIRVEKAFTNLFLRGKSSLIKKTCQKLDDGGVYFQGWNTWSVWATYRLWGATIEKTTYMMQVMHTSHLDRFDEICLVRIVKLAVHTLRLSRYNNNFVMYSIDSFRKSLRKKKNVFLFHCIVINFPRRWPAEVVAKRKNTYAFVECSDKIRVLQYYLQVCF